MGAKNGAQGELLLKYYLIKVCYFHMNQSPV